MVAAATMMYGGNQSIVAAQSDTQQQSSDDQYLTTFFCRALYDYQSQDASSLSFYRGDIIEVLTQLESGWWDGLLNDERGWFPSNYVQPISDQEAEAELGPSEYLSPGSEAHDSGIDVSQSIGGGAQSDRDRDWLREEMEYAGTSNGLDGLASAAMAGHSTPNDFWVPQVTPDGQIYYVNTQTGERSRDLPFEPDAEAPDGALGVLSSVSSSHSGSASGLSTDHLAGRIGNVPSLTPAGSSSAGFGLTKRSGTPEPWVKRLADDGLTFYYVNKMDGQVQWTRPESVNAGYLSETEPQQAGRRPTLVSTSSSTGYTSNSSARDTLYVSSRMRSESVTSQQLTTSASSKRLSMYSDDSDIQPREVERHTRIDFTQPTTDVNGGSASADRAVRKLRIHDGVEEEPLELTSAELAAMQLQQALAPSDPESIEMLSDRAREAIIGVMHVVDDTSLPKGPNQDKEVEDHVTAVVVAVRNLLYISCAVSGPLLNNLSERNAGDPTATAAAHQLQSFLKTSQRKVTATLSKLVLSTRAARCKHEMLSADMMVRVEQDAADLQRAVDSFVVEVQKRHGRTAVQQLHARVGRKRLHGVFGLGHIGIGLPGAGVAGSWKGFGYVGIKDIVNLPQKTLSADVVGEVKAHCAAAGERLSGLSASLENADKSGILANVQEALTYLSAFLLLASDVHVAQHVNVDSIHRQQDGISTEDIYLQAVEQARLLVRTLEVSLQSLYDESATLLLNAQAESSEMLSPLLFSDGRAPAEVLRATTVSLKANMLQVQEIFEALLMVGQDQREAAHNDSRPLSTLFSTLHERETGEGEDVVDIEVALRRPGGRSATGLVESTVVELVQEHSAPSQDPVQDGGVQFGNQPDVQGNEPSTVNLVAKPLPPTQIAEEEPAPGFPEKSKSPPRAAKIRQLLGDDAPERYIENANADAKPWYLRSNYSREEVLINPDGGVRAGTLSALVEKLTTHEYGDPTFNKTFLMTYKSFTTLDNLFDSLVHRYRVQPPDNLNAHELGEWTRLKQHFIRIRVLNTFKTMVTDEDVLERDDMYILDRMKDFISSPDVSQVSAAKHLLILIDRAKIGGDAVVKMTAVTPSFPPPPIVPKVPSNRTFKLLDIDPLEMARQLTILESRLYNKIRASECLQRSREQKGEHHDHIADVIQMTNKIANWVNNTVLEKEDSRKRAAIVKQFISIADRCRTLHNFSSMVAIISGLNSPPIRRLKRTWEQVNGRFMSQLGTCEMTVDTGKNFTNYRATLAKISPPCIPFIGVYLTVLVFIQEGSKDILPGSLINFGKRQKAAEVIREIKHWQSKPFNLTPLPPVLAFVEDSLNSFNDPVEWSDYFWNISLEREPREREDEKMARLLQESGFL